MFIKKLIFFMSVLTFYGCENSKIKNEYPKDIQLQVVQNQAKYGSISSEFNLSKEKYKISHKNYNQCEQIKIFLLNKFDKINIIKEDNENCMIKAFNGLDCFVNAIYANSTLNVVVYNKNKNNVIKDSKKSLAILKELNDFIDN